MEISQLHNASQNIRYYVFLKVFTKRVFLPLSAIYFVEEAGFSLQTIGVLGSIFAISQLLAELPTGYFADRFGKVLSIRLGALLNIFSTLLFVFMANTQGIFAGQILQAVGYSFLVGAGEALIHDSLVVKKKVDDYTKILSRAQSIALIINAGLIAFIPMTYAIDPRLPFLLGTLAYIGLFLVSLGMHDVQIPEKKKAHLQKLSFRKLFALRHLLGFGLLFGAIGALYTAPSDFVNIAFKEYGLNPEFLGWVFAIASLIGAILGKYFHLMKRLSIKSYMIVDCLMLVLPFFAIYTQNLPFLIVSFLANMSFWRYRRIIYQEYMLKVYSTKYKATLISAMSYMEELNWVWIPPVIGLLVTSYGLANGFAVAGVGAAVLSILYVLVGVRVLRLKSTKTS